MITHLDHIAIAVPDLAAAIARFADDFGLTLSGTEDVATEQTATPRTEGPLLGPTR